MGPNEIDENELQEYDDEVANYGELSTYATFEDIRAQEIKRIEEYLKKKARKRLNEFNEFRDRKQAYSQ